MRGGRQLIEMYEDREEFFAGETNLKIKAVQFQNNAPRYVAYLPSLVSLAIT